MILKLKKLLKKEKKMPKIIRREKRVDWLYYEAEVTEEQLKKFHSQDDKFMDDIWELDWDLSHQKSGNDEHDYYEADSENEDLEDEDLESENILDDSE